MARWTGSWLEGPPQLPRAEGDHRGRRFGLPETGPGAVASFGQRAAGFVLDVVAGSLLGGLVNAFVVDPDPLARTLAANGAFALQVLVLVALTGQSLGMRVVGIRVVDVRNGSPVPGFLASALRTAMLLLLVPALVWDRDGRGLHDKLAGTAVVRVR